MEYQSNHVMRPVLAATGSGNAAGMREAVAISSSSQQYRQRHAQPAARTCGASSTFCRSPPQPSPTLRAIIAVGFARARIRERLEQSLNTLAEARA